MKLFLAPMDGVIDFILRDLITELGGVDLCFTEFIRVTQQLHSPKTFYKYCPELRESLKGKTKIGTPVHLQFLGNDPNCLAENAALAVELGALGVDLNFGCPSRRVNHHFGGAVLLKSPELIYKIVHQVRSSIPAEIPLTAKIRLGYSEPSECFENAQAIEDGGAQWITVHCRTKIEAYKPPAHWEWIPRIQERIKIPLVVNGEIWNRSDFENCAEISQAKLFMLGRGAIANPFLFLDLKRIEHSFDWKKIRRLLLIFAERTKTHYGPAYSLARSKQWLKHLALSTPEAGEFFEQTKELLDLQIFEDKLGQIQD